MRTDLHQKFRGKNIAVPVNRKHINTSSYNGAIGTRAAKRGSQIQPDKPGPMRIKLVPTAPSALRFTGEISAHAAHFDEKYLHRPTPTPRPRAANPAPHASPFHTRLLDFPNVQFSPPSANPLSDFPNPSVLQIARNPSAGNPPIPSGNSHLFEKRRPEPPLPKLQTPQTKKFPLGGARIFARNNGIKAHGNFASPLPRAANAEKSECKNPNTPGYK